MLNKVVSMFVCCFLLVWPTQGQTTGNGRNLVRLEHFGEFALPESMRIMFETENEKPNKSTGELGAKVFTTESLYIVSKDKRFLKSEFGDAWFLISIDKCSSKECLQVKDNLNIEDPILLDEGKRRRLAYEEVLKKNEEEMSKWTGPELRAFGRSQAVCWNYRKVRHKTEAAKVTVCRIGNGNRAYEIEMVVAEADEQKWTRDLQFLIDSVSFVSDSNE